MNNDSSGVNTVLIVFLLLIVVGGFVWYATQMRSSAPQESARDINVDLNIPTGGGGGGGGAGGQTQ